MSTSDDQAARPSEDHSSRSRKVKDNVSLSAVSSPSDTSKGPSPRQGHQRLVFSDPVAFRYLEEDPATTVFERRQRLKGYEIYLVEQWACSRIHPTFVIATYTGDLTHSILVDVLSIPKDESTWSKRLKVYFRAISEYHAREKETPLGVLMVTNLSGFPSSLTVISVPDGDVRQHREDFIVNEDLKRLGCAGRAGLNLQNPQPSTAAKFHHLYRTSDSVPLYTSVMELVKICQVALLLYGKLAPAYADGLLCDVTEESINNWWSDIGTYTYNIEPNDGILGPSTVSALVVLLIGAFNLMKATGAPVGKDAFDIASTKRAIGYFQKSQKLERTRRLDRQTLMKLHKVTAKTASGESWTVPKAVKSTVAELSGKGGEMVMGIVGGREKVGIAEIETLDIERLAQLVTGSKARWLWQGKAARSNEAETFGSFGPSGTDKIFSTDDQGNYMWTSKHRDSVRADNPTDQTDDSDIRTGFGRFKDAVGLPILRSHQPRPSREEVTPRDERAHKPPPNGRGAETEAKEPFPPQQKGPIDSPATDLTSSLEQNTSQMSFHSEKMLSRQTSEDVEPEPVVVAQDLTRGAQERSRQLEGIKRKLSLDTSNRFFLELRNDDAQPMGLRRSQSAVKVTDVRSENPRVNYIPRYLSFSTVESVLLDWDDIETVSGSKQESGEPGGSIAIEEADALFVRVKAEKISYLEQVTIPFTERQVQDVDELDQLSQRYQNELNTLYYERLEDYQTQKATSTDVMMDERQGLNEGLRRVEMLGAKLDYELNALSSRVEEVEDGVNEFERAVRNIEGRVNELVNDDNQRDPWWFYLVGIFRSR